MVLARVAEVFSPRPPSHIEGEQSSEQQSDGRPARGVAVQITQDEDEDEEVEARPPYTHVWILRASDRYWLIRKVQAILAGGLGGLAGDMLMHSLDTVKTRQQGDTHRPPKYSSLGSSYLTILRQEGVRRGLYGGWKAAALGSFGGTSIFFGTYEWSKRVLVDAGVAPSLAYFTAGLVADLFASPVYVPTEVIKTRLQLQGRPDNPHFTSGSNYRSTAHAVRTVVRQEGARALFHGYRATLYRDLPFSALQFAIYEKERELAKRWVGRRDIGIGFEIATGATAGCLAGIATCPLDVVKTRIQTQLPASPAPSLSSSSSPSLSSSTAPSSAASRRVLPPLPTQIHSQKRLISTSSPSTSVKRPGSVTLDTSSVMTGLRAIYRAEGVPGLFRGVGPRAVWTSIQSATMLVLYQAFLRQFDDWHLFGEQAD